MFEGLVQRLARVEWGKLATTHVQGKDEPDPKDLKKGIEGNAKAIEWLAAELRNAFAENAPLIHQTTVQIETDSTDVPERGTDLTVTGDEFKDQGAALKVRNSLGVVNLANAAIANGWAIVAQGPVNINPNNAGGIALVINGDMIVENITNKSGDSLEFNYTSFAGYVAGNKQILGHDTSGVLTWYNTSAC